MVYAIARECLATSLLLESMMSIVNISETNIAPRRKIFVMATLSDRRTTFEPLFGDPLMRTKYTPPTRNKTLINATITNPLVTSKPDKALAPFSFVPSEAAVVGERVGEGVACVSPCDKVRFAYTR